MKINRGREAGAASERRTETFSGEVWADPVLSGGNVDMPLLQALLGQHAAAAAAR